MLHAAATCKTSYDAAVSMSTKPNYLMNSNSIKCKVDNSNMSKVDYFMVMNLLMHASMNTQHGSGSGTSGANRPLLALENPHNEEFWQAMQDDFTGLGDDLFEFEECRDDGEQFPIIFE